MNNVRVDTDLMAVLPEWYKDIEEYQQIIQAEGEQGRTMLSDMTAVKKNFFFGMMDESAVSEWESIFGIIPNLQTEDLDFRRDRLVSRMTINPPFSIRYLQNRLDELIGKDKYVLTVDGPAYTIYVEASAKNQSYAIEVSHMINMIKPAHIVYLLTPYIEYGMLASEEIYSQAFNKNYRLGSWGLGLNPFVSPGEESQRKMAFTPSLKPGYLAAVSAASLNEISKARINGSVLIEGLERSVEGDRGVLTYTIHESDADSVSRIELLDSSNNVLVESNVYVPIAQETLLKHVFKITEGVID